MRDFEAEDRLRRALGIGGIWVVLYILGFGVEFLTFVGWDKLQSCQTGVVELQHRVGRLEHTR